MKKLLLPAFICLVCFYACKKPDNNPSFNPEKIVGKWMSVKRTYVSTKNGVDSITNTLNVQRDSIYFLFSKDGFGAYTESGINTPFSYTFNKDSLYISLAQHGYSVPTLTSTDLVIRYKDHKNFLTGVTYNIDEYLIKQ